MASAGAADVLRDALGVPIPPVELADYERSVSAARVHLGERAFTAAWSQGRAMTPEQALAAQGQKPILRSTTTISPPTYPAGLAEPAGYELVYISQEEDTPGQRCNEHEEPGEARQTKQSAAASPTPAPAKAHPSARPVVGKLDLDLSAFELAHHLLQRTWLLTLF